MQQLSEELGVAPNDIKRNYVLKGRDSKSQQAFREILDGYLEKEDEIILIEVLSTSFVVDAENRTQLPRRLRHRVQAKRNVLRYMDAFAATAEKAVRTILYIVIPASEAATPAYLDSVERSLSDQLGDLLYAVPQVIVGTIPTELD